MCGFWLIANQRLDKGGVGCSLEGAIVSYEV